MILGWPHALIALVALQRLLELARARHNTRVLLARGGREAGARHYPLFMLLHGGWLAVMFALAAPDAVPDWPWLALFALCQGLRVWVIVTLGPWWTTRIITVDGAEPVAAGPYRFVRHPNYAIVAVEIVALPLGIGLPAIALVFGLLNVALLAWRIRIEDAARRQL
jgi:methyltransferase